MLMRLAIPLRIALIVCLMLCFGMSPAFAVNGAPEGDLRIGDILTISLPGEQSLNKDFQIDRRGQVTLPETGAVMLANLPIDKAREEIRARLSRIYKDLDRLTITLKERRLLLNVLGYVKTPGPVELPGDATVQTALSAAGGLASGAQLDRLKVRRGKEELVFDYKKYLDTGDTALIPELKPLDVIFVPASPRTGNVQMDVDSRVLSEAGDGGDDRSAIKIFGEVNKPGTFAYKPGLTAVDMLMRAGGVTRYATVEQVRIISKGEPVLFNLQNYLDHGEKTPLAALQPGATIFVPKQAEDAKHGANAVYVMGEVAKPGAFEARPGAGFIDVLANAGGPTRHADTRQIRVLRASGEVAMFDMPAFTEGKGGKLPEVKPGDAILVPERPEGQAENSWLKTPSLRAVRVMGSVNKPGRYDWSDDMSLLDLIAQSGGPSAHADIANISIVANGREHAPIRFDLQRYIASGGAADLPKLKGGYTVMIPELPQADAKGQWTKQAPEASIYVMGQVGAPGRYAFNTGLHFLDIVAAANGPTNAADIRNIRVSHRGQKGSYVSKVNLARYFETGDDSLLPRVKPGDVIYVPDRNKEWIEERKETTVRVLGAINKPGRYKFSDDLTILDLLAEAGGPRNDALDSKILVVNFTKTGEQARLFDLVGFAKSGDIGKLPVVRAGDLVYVPNVGQGDWKIFMDGVRDAVSAGSLAALIGTL